MSPDARVIQFADWRDGDGWWIDLDTHSLRWIDVGGGSEDMSYVRERSIAVLPDFGFFVTFITCEAKRKPWVLENLGEG